ncbi:PREDICTED: protein FAM26F [Myotis davidii]|uniref:protein FAM26F n=1 Tax=Myotis davidii TaxID=225400 RepID=UPI00076791DD|nr:PREDICTED: protein FAM26F [Myotis davidii]
MEPMKKLQTVLDLYLKHRITLGYGLLTLLTAGGERIFSAVVFQCPCSAWNLSYGLVFLLVPALALFLLGYALRARTWRLLVLGWILIAVVIVCLLIIVAVTRCVSPVSFLQLSFWKIYVEQEQKILRSQATEHATELANENVKCFFEGSHPKECKTPSMKDWQQVSELYTFNPKNQYYSMLHKYVNREEKDLSIRISKGDAVVPVLDFVDSQGMHTTAEL